MPLIAVGVGHAISTTGCTRLGSRHQLPYQLVTAQLAAREEDQPFPTRGVFEFPIRGGATR
jgi:hypothetical protein